MGFTEMCRIFGGASKARNDQKILRIPDQFWHRLTAVEHTCLTAARRAAVLSELRSDSWMTRSWRPALMFLLMAFLLFFGLILPLMELFAGRPLAVEPHLDRIPEPLWNLLALGVGGYVGGRTVEKIAAHWARPAEPRPSGGLPKTRPKR